MMQAGKWGIVVVMLAIVGTLVVSWTISMDVNEVEVTKYNPLADMTGEFDVEKTPDYVEYNPSTNYTGYYTDGSVIGNERYFDGVSFERSISGNNFKVNLPPTATDDGTLTLTGITTLSGYNATYYDEDPSSPVGYSYKYIGVKKSMLNDVVDAIGTQDWDVIKISSEDDRDEVTNTAGQDSSFGWVVFVPLSDWIVNSSNGHFVFLGSDYALANADISYLQPYYTGKVMLRLPYLAASIDLGTNTATLFYDKEMKQFGTTISTDEIVVLYGEWPSTSGAIKQIDLQDSLDYDRLVKAPATYMDPSKGVELE